MKLTIVTPERRVVGPVDVKSVTVPGEAGEMTILPGHARLVSLLTTGVFSFEQTSGNKVSGAISSGFLEVHNDQVTVMADTLELAQEIDVDRARRAQDKAKKMLEAKENFELDMQKWQRKEQRALIRLQASGNTH